MVSVVEYKGIRVTESEILEVQGNTPLMRVRRDKVESLSIARGLASERLIMEVLFGAALLVVGGAFIPHIHEWRYEGGSVADAAVMFPILAPLGLYLMLHAFRTRYLLIIKLSVKTRKVAFQTGVEAGGLRNFVATVKSEHDLTIEIPVSLGLA